MKVLVCGGSSYRDKAAVFDELDKLHRHQPISLIINGGARGADYSSSQWAKERCIPLRVFKADWQQFGDQAVFLLNDEMLHDAQPDLILAFPGGDVTSDMISKGKNSGIRLIIAAPQ